MAEELSIEKQLENVTEKVKSFATESMAAKAKEVFEAEKKALTDQVEALKTKVGENETKSATEKTDLETKLTKLNKDIEDLGVKFAKSEMFGGGSEKGQNFNTLVKSALKENKGKLSQIKAGSVNDFRMDIKAAGDENMEFTNFADDTYADLTTERRGLYQAPFAPIWLRTLFPNSTTTSDSIRYLKEDGGLGAVGPWDGSGEIADRPEKPGVSYKFTKETENIEWIAGITRIPREMFDDIPWLYAYITQQLTTGKRGLFVAENTFITNKLNANATAYDGDKTIPVEMLYDAGFGQLRDNYFNPSAFLMNHRDVINLIAFNKANGSGEYDLPNGTVSIIGGQLYLSGVPVIGAPNVAKGSALAFDRSAIQFISRMSPEIRMSYEERDNFIKNLITVRAEERIGMLVTDTQAIVKVTFDETT
ncbi:phage major capsid protein, HK97 family [Arachidicoccus rhizosphaerae]|uniref:Phage major capsid protein, HK97 family n=1 Tax=Arachidicoccus rhizosphaerae TaxID=551991 RepID=A0A1H3W543_9BACT|nr:phage major capsid protein [Arachidicoccus rhizosphaerae]SDZ82239.1 phage major capsid protein, HK97 family [Arachidicoccus rhizosphaerae]